MPQIEIENKIFRTQKECEEYTRSILKEVGITDSVKNKNEKYFSFLLSLCRRHPRHFDKLSKFSDFKIYRGVLNGRALALSIMNHDNTCTEISWRTCVTGKDKTPKSLFNSALRQCISYQIQDFRDMSDLSYCRACETSLDSKITHIDHSETQFIKLVEDFLAINPDVKIPNEYNKKDRTFETLFKDDDKWIGNLFESYHLQHATLRVLCETCNLTREKHKPK